MRESHHKCLCDFFIKAMKKASTSFVILFQAGKKYDLEVVENLFA